MTVISEPIGDIAGLGERQKVRFTVPTMRESADGTATVTTRTHEVSPVNGVLTTADLDPGPAKVSIGHDQYDIVIPASDTPIRLWPLIEAGSPPPPPDPESLFIRNSGGIRRAKILTQTAYAALVTPDPETFYIIIE